MVVAASALALVLATTGVAFAAVSIRGGGATFSAPFWQQVGADYQKKSGNTINYASVGSGAGIAGFTAGTYDFGGSDVPMTRAEQGKAQAKGVDVLHFPAVLGAITVSYNVSGLKTGLKLDGRTIANIFLGNIAKWNDSQIAALNKGVKLPNQNITVVHRSDSSGTSFNFTTFLAQTSPAWARGPGIGKTVQWPKGVGGNGNPGVAAAIKQTKGSIGYVELAFAVQNQFTYASVKNQAGKYLPPTRAATAAAAVGIKIPPTLKVSIVNSPNKNAYPISAASFAMVYKDPCKAGLDSAKATALSSFLKYAVGSEGQKTAKKLLYAPLPAGLQKKTLTAIGTLTCNGKAIK
jgi:phosphate transport system substrate-binding protein